MKILAAGDAIDKSKVLAKDFTIILGQNVQLEIYLFSKDLLSYLSTQKHLVDRYVRADSNDIPFEFDTGKVKRNF